MNGANAELVSCVLKKLAALFGNRSVPQEWWSMMVRNLGEIESAYRDCPEFKEPTQEEKEDEMIEARKLQKGFVVFRRGVEILVEDIKDSSPEWLVITGTVLNSGERKTFYYSPDAEITKIREEPTP